MIPYMRLFKLSLLVFIFNVAFMPLLTMAHDLSHGSQELTIDAHWKEFGQWDASAIFQFAGDDSHHGNDVVSDSSHADAQHETVSQDNRHCHHVTVFGMATNHAIHFCSIKSEIVASRVEFGPGIHAEPLDYPPKHT